jgi:hypothetical protein
MTSVPIWPLTSSSEIPDAVKITLSRIFSGERVLCELTMPNVQVIDGADNCTFDIYSLSDSDFETIFPDEQFDLPRMRKCTASTINNLQSPNDWKSGLIKLL